MYQFLCIFRTQMAGQMDRLLDPYPIVPSFVCFLLLEAPALAPLPSTHYWKRVYVLVWCDSLSVASTGHIFEQCKIETFVMSMTRRDGHRCCSIKMHKNDRKCDRKQLLDVIYTGVGVGGGVSPLPVSASSISAIFHLNNSFSAADIFCYDRKGRGRALGL